MVTQDDIVYELTSKEFFFLTQMLGIQSIAGFDDPYRGFLISEIEEEFAEIKEGLITRKLLLPHPDSNTYDIEDALGICLTACGAEDAVYTEKRIEGRGSYKGFLYFLPDLVVERTRSDQHDIILTPVGNAEVSMGLLFRVLPLTLRSERSCRVDVGDCTWEKWSSLDGTGRKDLLVGSECDIDDATSIVQTFNQGERSGSMVYWNKNGYRWYREGLHYAQMNQELYLVTELEEQRLRIESYDPELVLSSLIRFGKRFDLVVEGV